MFDIHTHTLTLDHVPDRFLPWPLVPMLRTHGGQTVTNWLLHKVGTKHPLLRRVKRFLLHAEEETQQANWAKIVQFHLLSQVGYVPRPTIVMLPMDFTFAGLGRVPVCVEEQVAEALEMRYLGVEPLVFLPVDPRRSHLAEWVKDIHRAHPRLAGLKMYPSLGFHIDDPLLDATYKYAQANNLPVTIHMGGTTVRGRDVSESDALRLMSFEAVRDVANRFHGLRLNMAHAGGGSVWVDFDRARMAGLLDVLGQFPNVYTDVSYTAFSTAARHALSKWLPVATAIDRVLFGSDMPFISLERGRPHEAMRELRDYIGEERWGLMTETNPHRFLFGEDD